MWTAITAVIGFIRTLVGFFLKSKKTPQKELIDDVNKRRRKRSSITDKDELAMYDLDQRRKLKLLLRLKRFGDFTKRSKDT